jgi:hypothetical protein
MIGGRPLGHVVLEPLHSQRQQVGAGRACRESLSFAGQNILFCIVSEITCGCETPEPGATGERQCFSVLVKQHRHRLAQFCLNAIGPRKIKHCLLLAPKLKASTPRGNPCASTQSFKTSSSSSWASLVVSPVRTTGAGSGLTAQSSQRTSPWRRSSIRRLHRPRSGIARFRQVTY